MRGVWLRLVAVFFGLSAIAAGSAMAAGERVALVIGNSAYQHVGKLANPANDAAALAQSLERLGFAVTRLGDITGAEMRGALRDFELAASGAEIALVYYAGHGMEMNGINYLIPVDAALKRDTHVEDEAVSLARVQRAVEGASTLRLVLLDACRNNPFVAQMERNEARRSIGRGLARVEPPAQTLVAYAAKGGTTADDGDGDHSPYASALLEHMETPGLEINFLFRLVHDAVVEDTGGRQEPFVYGSLGATEIYLKPAVETPDEVAGPTPPPTQAPLPDAAPETSDHLADADYFAAITANTQEAYRAFLGKHPTSPRAAQVTALLSALVESQVWQSVGEQDTIAAYQRYLAAFPNGVYAADARIQMERLIDLNRQVASRDPDPLPKPVPNPTPVPTPVPDNCGQPLGDYSVVGVAANDVLWVRTRPNRNANTTGSLPPGAQGVAVGRCVDVSGYSKPWCEVRYQCISGWAYSRYLATSTGGGSTRGGETASANTTYRVANVAGNDVLNMRSGPGTQHAIVAEIPPNGAGVSVSFCQTVSGYSHKWCTVAWRGVSGWASACCLASERTGRKPD